MDIETSRIERTNFSLENSQAISLARHVMLLEEEYKTLLQKDCGVDVEWAIDGNDNEIYILQSRPETIHSNSRVQCIEKYILDQRSNELITGVAVGEKISSGCIRLLNSLQESHLFNKGDILVTDMTTPDWEPIMKISSGIITNKGGRTCHAAIVAREMGLNAVVGTNNATHILKDNDSCTIYCANGERGIVYEGLLPYHIDKFELKENFQLPVRLMMNVGNPESSFSSSLLPNKGVGLARLEFIINHYIQIHPNALVDYPNIRDDLRIKIRNILGSHDNPQWYFIKRLARGILKLLARFILMMLLFVLVILNRMNIKIY